MNSSALIMHVLTFYSRRLWIHRLLLVELDVSQEFLVHPHRLILVHFQSEIKKYANIFLDLLTAFSPAPKLWGVMGNPIKCRGH